MTQPYIAVSIVDPEQIDESLRDGQRALNLVTLTRQHHWSREKHGASWLRTALSWRGPHLLEPCKLTLTETHGRMV